MIAALRQENLAGRCPKDGLADSGQTCEASEGNRARRPVASSDIFNIHSATTFFYRAMWDALVGVRTARSYAFSARHGKRAESPSYARPHSTPYPCRDSRT